MLGATAAAAGAILAGAMLMSDVYRHDIKADWREVAVYLDRRDPGAMAAVISAESSGNTELETARYYLEPGREVIPWSDQLVDLTGSQKRPTWVAIGLHDGRPVRELPAVFSNRRDLIGESLDFSRLRLMRLDFQQGTTPPESSEPHF